MAIDERKVPLVPVRPVCKKDCPNRKYDCHSKCEKYARYRAECDKLIAQRNMNRDVNDAIGAAMKRLPGKREV